MRKLFAVLATTTLLAAGAGPAAAQEMPERGQLVDITSLQVPPGSMDEFRDVIGRINEASSQAGLPEEFNWDLWMTGSEVAIVMPMTSWATRDDPMYFIKHFQGKPAMEMMEGAMRDLGAAGVKPTRHEVWEGIPSWGREGEATEPDYAYQLDLWYAPGTEEAMDASMKEIVGFFGEDGTGYGMQGFRVHTGDIGRVVFIVFPEDLSEFYGAQSLENYLTESGRGAEWEGIADRMGAWVIRMDEQIWQRLPGLSFRGGME